ncbi:hypothetical protein [Lacticaseibacillus pantheris]|uniref:hypothetical protein n=1 Tax=Lacticaseibacillus pantheris TaxID=171523 RepID=UPI000A9E5AA6|nr:hypothetical protein [Lacticaseibacillus pantheris]
MARTSEELLAQLRQQLTRGRVVWSTVWVRRLWTTILDLMWTVSILLALTSLFVYLSDPTLGALYWYQLTTPSFWSANIVLFWPWSVLIFFTVLEVVRYLARVGRVRNTAARIKRHPEAIIIAHTLNINARISMTYRQPEDARPVTQVIAALSDADKVVWKDWWHSAAPTKATPRATSTPALTNVVFAAFLPPGPTSKFLNLSTKLRPSPTSGRLVTLDSCQPTTFLKGATRRSSWRDLHPRIQSNSLVPNCGCY